MTDYASLKVPDLKKVLQERGLHQSGNKADLIARLQDHDKSQAEDVIDWDDDDTKIASAAPKKEEPKPAAAPAAAPAVAVAVAVDAVKDTKAAPTPVPADAKPAKPASTAAAEAPRVEATKKDEAPSAAADGADTVAQSGDEQSSEPAKPAETFSIGLEASNADEELKKREARAKRFGIATDANSEEAKKLERAKKFGIDTGAIVKGLDEPLPERRPKRGREQGDQAEGGGKRQSLDRRNEGLNGRHSKLRGGHRGGGRSNKHEGGGGGGKLALDPAEKAKAEARAKRFGSGN